MEQARGNIDYEAGIAALNNIIKMLEEKDRLDG